LSPKLKRLSGAQVVAIMDTFGFHVHSQRGSHAKLRRIGKRGEKQTLTIPLHAELDPGTVRAIMRQAARYIPETELQPHFYSH
jgi:predicted RNA binding protein YcfA (HicA-like mRNA interferase family)